MKKNNLKDSPLARFHKDLAGKKKWDLDRLVEEMRKIAVKAQKLAGAAYVKAMLHGGRPMPHWWQVAAANALEIALEDYQRQREIAISQRLIIRASELVLPIDYWPHLTWRSKFTAPVKIAARLYGLAKEGITATFCVIPEQWQPPAGFSGYTKLRDDAWQEFAANFVRMKKEPPNPKPIWHVRRLTSKRNSVVELEVSQADYRDILVTGNYQGLNHQIEIGSGQKCTVREWLASHWNPGDSSKPVLPGARQLVVNLMVVTRDGFAVLSRQGQDNPDSAGSWCTSTSTVMNPKTDSDSRQIPDLAQAASRGCKEELGMETDGTSVRWLTVAAGLKDGSITLFGVLESSWSKEEILKSVGRNVAKARRNRALVCEVVDVEFLRVTDEKIANRLKSHDYRPYLELGLALLLWQKGKAEFTEGVADSRSAKDFV
jgi:hypothetical protein